MRVRLVAVVALALMGCLLSAGAAQASCENRAFIHPLGPVNPGGTLTVTGERFEPGATARVKVGSQGGVVGESVVDAAGNFAVSFVVDSEMAEGTYLVHADAFHQTGELVIATTTVEVRRATPAPVEAPVPQGAPAPQPNAGAPAPRHQARAPEPQRAPSAPATPGVQPQPASVTEPAAATVEAPVAEPRAGERARAGSAEPRSGVVDVPRDAAASRLEAPRAAPVARAVAEGSGFAGSALVIALGTLLLAAAAAAGGYALGRRRPPLQPAPLPEPPSGPEPGTAAAAADPVEASLQELLAEEHAREAERPRTPVG